MAALYVPIALAIVGIAYGAYTIMSIFKKSEGTEKMREISAAIREGSDAYLSRQFKTVAIFVVMLFALIYYVLGMQVAAAFMVGAIASGLVGYFGMYVSVRSNARAAQASLASMQSALEVPFSAGVVSGALVSGVGLLGVSAVFLWVYASAGANSAALSEASKALIGFGFGANLLALFMRVGGGIYTKAADVGADLVGKVEKGIPEDDPRNPATIADNVGDNVGDCAGMGADVFESYTVTIISTIILGALTFGLAGALFPMVLVGGASLLGLASAKAVKVKRESEYPFNAMKRGFSISMVLQAVFFFALSMYVLDSLPAFLALLSGLVVTYLIMQLTDYYTSTKHKPVQEIATAARSGAGTNLIAGLGVGMESAVAGVLLVGAAILAGFFGFGAIFPDLGAGLGYFGIALVGLGMLSTTAMIMAMDTFGPISDNANGIGEMSGLDRKGRKRMDVLDAVGNTTKAVTKGFAISSAAIAAVALFSTFFETAGLQAINVALPSVFIGLLIGGAVPFIFSSLTMNAVGRAAKLVVEEVRRQFKDPRIMKGTKKPDYASCVDISTKAAIDSLYLPGAIAILTPVVIGYTLGLEALGGFLAGAILVGQLMAVFMSNAGGAWDNAKKYIEEGHFGGKGSDAHKAAVVGDTVGDPFKDTSGPALNPMIKVLNIVSLLVAAIIAGKQIGAI